MSLRITCNYLAHTLVSNLSTCVRELQRWPKQKYPRCFPKYLRWPTTRQADEEDLHLKARSKTVIILSLHVSWRTSQTVGDHTLLQIWWPQTTLSIRYTASSSGRLNCCNLESKNSTCMYYVTVNKCILLTANKRIHTYIISPSYLAAASNKHVHRLTSLYGSCQCSNSRLASSPGHSPPKSGLVLTVCACA